MGDKIFVTSPLMPPLEEFMPYLQKIWQNRILTNGGEFHQELEEALARYLGVKYVCLFANGTLALLTALQALRVTGEVITTPYSFVATSHTLLWNGLTPVFVDIDPHTFNIDPERIEELITPQTTAIMPVHCYGIPCNVDKIQQIADIYGLKVIYDAAHAFGVRQSGTSILNHGDLSVLSFHATKVFNTFEGGAIICHDSRTKQRIDYLKNFGFAGETRVVAPGINAKMNEMEAAFGLLQLQYIDNALLERASISKRYSEALKDIPGVTFFDAADRFEWNHSYYPILIDSSFPLSRDALYEALKTENVYCRRYFYPLISSFAMYSHLPSAASDKLPVASRLAEQILCLPIYPDLQIEEQMRVIDILRRYATIPLINHQVA
ncbi:DegT/DnrJ/EryC1/StrS family aminotransferase [Enterobacter roggenkampii]|jgi:dTDP-4-amino-4,6-dideoxygalactose transaminase|uniref:DegT/DnrJ/EryC1/StrS family aminotransferase n=1 Tax=Enterobacter TaxID=547 RepID=UPI0005178394|nr:MULTISPECIES: DegT/DnrJ/EryC1/StrS family aminotransferase [Enterobacter]OIR50244.1 aminotransferase [Lelliottia nimipressuralis]RWS67231.1 DegT/DnrJ/EryC1/StrS family aminotransferase [Enterobacter cloacae]EKU9173670.1 DegT/DnrJ/EryC1/StrS family aminotransferase [Enterobacter roggenkampii MGH 34]EKU9556667.1 DegT/DnrJ/EryC1/StrS family aminotransferase [Enterobacter roggenkampii MGH 34]EKW7742551.1 DegT/DnrJ/EryC1/StrS family aminotransferase [Enterobacter roggenkampii]